jgi:hypothetical protein
MPANAYQVDTWSPEDYIWTHWVFGYCLVEPVYPYCSLISSAAGGNETSVLDIVDLLT